MRNRRARWPLHLLDSLVADRRSVRLSAAARLARTGALRCRVQRRSHHRPGSAGGVRSPAEGLEAMGAELAPRRPLAQVRLDTIGHARRRVVARVPLAARGGEPDVNARRRAPLSRSLPGPGDRTFSRPTLATATDRGGPRQVERLVVMVNSRDGEPVPGDCARNGWQDCYARARVEVRHDSTRLNDAELWRNGRAVLVARAHDDARKSCSLGAIRREIGAAWGPGGWSTATAPPCRSGTEIPRPATEHLDPSRVVREWVESTA